jgi:protein Tex
VHTLADLEPGMVLEGVVTNVAAFGAFVDVGVHTDGLVHVSAMARGFVSDPRSVAKPGDVVRVKVLSVDTARQRISLTMRLDDPADGGAKADSSPRGSRPSSSRTHAADSPASPSLSDGAGPRGSGSRGQETPSGGGGRRSGRPDDRRGGPPASGGAMADALRRAGLLDDSGVPAKGKPVGGKPRSRDDRP